MWYDGIFESLLALRDEERAPQMSAYMRNQFPFLGIPTGPRKAAYKKYLAIAKKEKIVDFDFVDQCFKRDSSTKPSVGACVISAKRIPIGCAHSFPRIRMTCPT